MEMPDCFYRISVKALVLNETRDKFLIVQDVTGGRDPEWELPGGGLDHGASVKEELQRELQEEMGLQATWIADYPSYFLAGPMRRASGKWAANVIYEATLEHFDFTPSDECVAISWVGHDNADQFRFFPNVPELLKQFDPTRHQH